MGQEVAAGEGEPEMMNVNGLIPGIFMRILTGRLSSLSPP